MLYPTLKETPLTLSKIEPYQTWCIATAIAKHFEEGSKYDATKYNYKLKWLTPMAFGRRRDQWFYEKVAQTYKTKDEVIRFCVSNVLKGNTWINDMSDEVYNEYKGKLQSFPYIFKNDLKSFDTNNFNDLFEVRQMPRLVEEMFAENISLETVTVLDAILDWTSTLDSKVSDVLVWPTQKERIIKYRPFVQQWINVKKLKEAALDVFRT